MYTEHSAEARTGSLVDNAAVPAVEMQRASINQELKRHAAAVRDNQFAAANNSISYLQ